MSPYHKNIRKKLLKLDRKVDFAIGVTPIRQIIDAALIYSSNLLNRFDEARYYEDEQYAELIQNLSEKFHEVTGELTDQLEEVDK